MELEVDQIEVFATGLYELAHADAVDERELAILREFLEEAGAPELFERLPELTFDPVRAYAVLGTSWLRKLFLETALLLIRQDGQVSAAERETLAWMARGFGLEGGVAALETALGDATL